MPLEEKKRDAAASSFASIFYIQRSKSSSNMPSDSFAVPLTNEVRQ
jgi:hypothetical protein